MYKYNYKLIIYLLYIYIHTKLYIHKIIYIYIIKSYIYIHTYIIYIYIITYGSEVWNRGMERILQGGMERGYGTGVVPELVPDLLFWLAPIYIYIWLLYILWRREEILHQLVTIGNYEALFTSWDHNGMFTIIAIYQLMQDFATSIHSNCQ